MVGSICSEHKGHVDSTFGFLLNRNYISSATPRWSFGKNPSPTKNWAWKRIYFFIWALEQLLKRPTGPTWSPPVSDEPSWPMDLSNVYLPWRNRDKCGVNSNQTSFPRKHGVKLAPPYLTNDKNAAQRGPRVRTHRFSAQWQTKSVGDTPTHA